MKTLALIAALLISNFFSHAQEDTNGITITVTVPNVINSEGEVLFGLYDENTFMTSSTIQSENSDIINGVAKVTFKNVPKGVFAITCFHDQNSNHIMDFEENGIPRESYGTSNNNMSYGPPVWSEAKFEVGKEDLDLEIRM